MTKENASAPKWILPPGLNKIFNQFINLYDTVFKKPMKRRPLIIQGAPGVGKSLLTYAFETLYRRDYPGKLTESDVKRVNVSALAENLFESEIFGHIKGSFTGALSNKEGFLENTKLIILEEIGELSKPIQAKLLTFMEDGIYYRLGSTVPGKSADDIQIIATTNAPLDTDHFRQDFLDRCFTFSVPALYERRGDILYVLAYQYPDFFRSLTPYQLMLVLCYNWPGNMREIEKFGTTMTSAYCQNNFFDDLRKHLDMSSQLYEMKFNRQDIEILLNRANLSMEMQHNELSKEIEERRQKSALKNLIVDTIPVIDFPHIKTFEEVKAFSKAIRYFQIFPLLFKMNPRENFNFYDAEVMTNVTLELPELPELPELLDSPHTSLFFYACLGEDFPDKEFDLLNENALKCDEYWKKRIARKYPTTTKSPLDTFSTTETDLLKSHYRELLLHAKGNIAEVARRSGVNRKTLDNKLISLGIHPTRKKKLSTSHISDL